MFAWIYVSPAAAVKAVKNFSGNARINLSEADLAALTPEEREELGQTVGLGEASLKPTDERNVLGQGWDAKDASLDELKRLLNARRAKRVTVERDRLAARREMVLSVAHDTRAWLAGERPCPYDPFMSSLCLDTKEKEEFGTLIAEAKAKEEADLKARLDRGAAAWTAWIAVSDARGSTETVPYGASHGECTEREIGARPEIKAAIAAFEVRAQARAKAVVDAANAAFEAGVRLYGSKEQVERMDDGWLSDDEGWTIIRDGVFAAMEPFPRYERLTKNDLDEHAPVEDVSFGVTDAESLSGPAYSDLKALVAAAPEGATLTPRLHTATGWGEIVTRLSCLVSVTWHGKTLSREYALSE